MAMTIPILDEPRRDQWGRYLVVPPGGGKPLGYTRVTTVAKVTDDGGGLAPWKATMAVVGMLKRRGLRAQWEALLAQYDDPWYDGEQAKAAAKRLVEECASAGGADNRKEIGIALHAITALIDAGVDPQHLTEETEADLAAYTKGLLTAGITILPGAIELQVVLDEFRVAGTFDRLANVPGFELPLIADLKTGSSLDYSWGSFAVQLAAYAHGEAIYRQGAAVDGSDDVRLEMPGVDQSRGLILWLPAGEARFEAYLVDIEAGWKAFEQSLWVRQWRSARDLAYPLAEHVPDDLTPALEASLAAVVATEDPTPALRQWLQDRINVIGAIPDARKDLLLSWPSDLPTLQGFSGHTPEQLEAIERVLIAVEARHQVTFPPPKPGNPVGQLVRLFPGSTVTDGSPAA